jgi:hypothetical protein
MSFIHECIPENTITIRPNVKPWMDNLLRKTIRIRNRLRKRAQATKNESDWIRFKAASHLTENRQPKGNE